jgi:hypothetical protein
MNLGMGIDCGNIIYLDIKLSYFVDNFIIMALQ